MRLDDAQNDFLAIEFFLGTTDIEAMSAVELRELREKCFDIEVEEAMKVPVGLGESSFRCKIATEMVDILLEKMMEIKKNERVAEEATYRY